MPGVYKHFVPLGRKTQSLAKKQEVVGLRHLELLKTRALPIERMR